MMRRIKPWLLACLVLAGAPLQGAPVAVVPPEPACACQPIGPDAAAAAVRQATGGRVLGVQSRQRNDRPVYEVKVLLDGGRVRVLRVDGCTGQVLG